MLKVVKPRALACALVFAACANAPQMINADEVSGFSAVVIPATSQTGVKSATTLQDPPLAIALAEIHGISEKSSARARLRKKQTTWSTPARFFTINQVIAKGQNGLSPLEFASIRSTDTPSVELAGQISPTQGEEPFGLFTFKAPDGLISMKWRKLQSEIDTEAPVIERCRAEPATCTPAAAHFVAITKDAAALPLRAKLQLVNDRINAAIRYTEDWAQWHQVDVWSAPLNISHKGSLDTGMGDCEDYAIAKYAALRQAGVAEKDLRILLVKDQSVHLDHAVLAARDEGHWVILDNRWSRLADDNELRQFVPLFAMNQDGLKLFAAPYANRVPPSGVLANNTERAGYIDASLSNAARSAMSALGALPLLM